MNRPHILVDFDCTLATYESWEKQKNSLGSPVPAMVRRVQIWLESGLEVRIFTARASASNPRRKDDVKAIEKWCEEHIGVVLEVTNEKDFETLAIWDDRAVTVEANVGWRWSAECPKGTTDPLTYDEEARYTGYADDPEDPICGAV